MEFLMTSDGWERHLDEDQAERYAMGRLTEEEQAQCEEHLLVCNTCRDQVEEADRFVAAMKSATAAPLKKAPRKRLPWFGIRPAWGLAAAVLVIGGVFLSRYEPVRPPVQVRLSAMRGGIVGTTAPTGADLVLYADVTGLSQSTALRLELVDSSGQLVWSGPYAAGGVRAPRQTAGTYFVRVRDAQGKLLREYGLTVAKRSAVSDVPR
jgi:hypothetical protein